MSELYDRCPGCGRLYAAAGLEHACGIGGESVDGHIRRAARISREAVGVADPIQDDRAAWPSVRPFGTEPPLEEVADDIRKRDEVAARKPLDGWEVLGFVHGEALARLSLAVNGCRSRAAWTGDFS